MVKTKYKLLQAKSLVVTCNGCGHWLNRGPAFLGTEGEWQCEKCGCTSTMTRAGRPFGAKSREWEWIEKAFNDLSPYFGIDEAATVITDPPLQNKPKQG